MVVEKEKWTLKKIVKKVLRTGTFIGAGAVTGCLLKKADLSSLKGIGKLCAGLGILGLSTAAADAAANTIDKEVDEVADFIEDISTEDAEDTSDEEGDGVVAST